MRSHARLTALARRYDGAELRRLAGLPADGELHVAWLDAGRGVWARNPDHTGATRHRSAGWGLTAWVDGEPARDDVNGQVQFDGHLLSGATLEDAEGALRRLVGRLERQAERRAGRVYGVTEKARAALAGGA